MVIIFMRFTLHPAITTRIAWLSASVILAGACFYFAGRQAQASGAQIIVTTLRQTPGAAVSASSADNIVATPKSSTPATPKTAYFPNCSPLAFGTPAQLDLASTPDSLSVQADQATPYRIYGNTADDLRTQIKRCAPDAAGSADAEFAAQTDYSLTWQYSVVVNNTSCTLTDVKVGLHTAMALPVWQPTSAATPGLAGRWQTFANSLATHEQGHADIDKTYAAKLLSDLNNMSPVPCDAITADASTVVGADVLALNQANDTYDTATNHGATQGAVLPTY
jgi:predicted secreted Zn-dependent protease